MWSNEELEKVMDMSRNEHEMRIVTALFCEMRFVSHARYFPAYTTLETEELKKPKKKKVQFL